MIAPGDEIFARMVLEVDMQEEPVPTDALITDPVVEAAYEELPDEDKKEYPTLKDALQVSRARGRAAKERVVAARKRASTRNGNGRRVRRRLFQDDDTDDQQQ